MTLFKSFNSNIMNKNLQYLKVKKHLEGIFWNICQVIVCQIAANKKIELN